MATIGFGHIQEFGDDKDINDNPISARVVPEESDGSLTLHLYIPIELRGLFKNLQENENVFYAVKADGTGVILGLIPDYTNGKFDDWDFILRNDNVPLQISADVHIKGNVHIEGNTIIGGDTLIEGNADTLGNLAADGEAYLGTGIEVTSTGVNIGGIVKIDGKTTSGSKPFNGFPAGLDTFTKATVDADTVTASPLQGQKANNNSGNYEKIDDNEERKAE
jgi:hypothetical protein